MGPFYLSFLKKAQVLHRHDLPQAQAIQDERSFATTWEALSAYGLVSERWDLSA